MIVATITMIALVFGGGAGFSFDIYKKAADAVIQDKQIVKQVKFYTKEADKEMKNWQKDTNKFAKQIVEMNQNYDLARVDAEHILHQIDTRRNEFQKKLLQLRFQVKELMSQEEWESMYAHLE
ncbi:MAG: hypothetical protein JRE14_08190 [Deltaproteobacteria bacterium]|nr:hypothetical protein [Deltaproteobacteria bacterium]